MEDKYEVKVTAGANGSVTPGMTSREVIAGRVLSSYGFGEETATADENYTVDKWVIVGAGADGADVVLAEASRTEAAPTSMNFGGRTVTGNTEYQVQFALDENGNNIPDYLEDKYEVKVTAGANGSVTPGTSSDQVLKNHALSHRDSMRSRRLCNPSQS